MGVRPLLLRVVVGAVPRIRWRCYYKSVTEFITFCPQKDVRENCADVVGDASSALNMTEEFDGSVSTLFLLRRLRYKINATAAIIKRRASEPPTAPPITAPETLLGLGAAAGGGVK